MASRIKIEFDTENAAFAEDPDEVARVLRQAARKAENMILFGRDKERNLFDSNGNRVGSVEVVTP